MQYKQMHQKLKLRDLTSGQALRNYRRRLAASAGKPAASVLTTKFKLDMPQDCPLAAPGVFEKYRGLYDVIEGCGPGTLTHFLFTALLSGFRVFGTAPEASLFSTRQSYDEEGFRDALTEAVGAPLPGFTVASLLKRLATIPRARANAASGRKKDISFNTEVMTQEYRKALCPKPPQQADSACVDRLLESIAQRLTQRFTSWKDVAQNPFEACQSIDDALKGFADFPSLAAMVEARKGELPANSTIAFDSSLPLIELSEEFERLAPHAVVSLILSYPESQDGSARASFVSSHLTTSKGAGLSWLFNKGLDLFRSHSVDDLAAQYGVPEKDKDKLARVKKAAEAIPVQDLFYKEKAPIGYHDFRTSFAGRMDSWTSNYIARLEELQGLLEKDIAEIKLPDLVRDGNDFLEETDCSREEIELLCAAVADAREKARNAISCLLGGAPERAAQSVDDIEAFSGIVNRLSAIRQQIFNVLDQSRDDKNSVWNKHAAEIKDAFKDWGALALLPKLNQMSGGVPHAQEKLEEEQRRFAAVQKAQGEHYEALMRWAQEAGDAGDVLQALCERERERAQKRRSGAVNCRELALRWVLQRLASTVRGRDDEAAEAVRGWFLRQRIFAEVKDFNKFFQNHLGRIYVSPYSNGRHQAYALTPGTVERGSEIWQSLLDLLRDQDESNGLTGEAAETRLRLRSLVMGMRISALKTLIPSRVAALHLEDEIAQEVVPEGLRLLLEQPGVAPSVMAKAFNLYQSLLSGALIVLRRERFYLRTKFMWVGNNALVYVPKSKEWNMPERYRKSKAWEEVFNLGVLEFTSSGAVDVGKTFVRALECLDKECIRELLHQLPHDWCYELPLQKASRRKSGENWVDALLVEKKGASGTVLVKYKSSRTLLARLVGPSTQKERLNELLLNPRVVVGDMTLLADQEVEQKLCADGLELALGRLEISIAAPITQPPVSAAARTPPFKRIVSIDQGEAGLGFAVFDLGEAGNAAAQPIACGLVSIPSLKRLIKGVRGYRRKGQSRQKFNQRFDSTMFTLRENAAGDVCGAIAGLMSRYSALPVLERDVSNLASGGKQLELVYKMVNARFVADQTQAHRLEREAWWYGAGAWSLPDLWQEVSLEYAARIGKDAARKTLRKENEKFYKKLTVYPGAAVRAHWTSRICSHCGGNISELVQRAKESGIKKVALNGNGEATLFGRTVRLYREPDAETKRKARRRNERADWTKPMGEGELSLEDFHKAARKNLRRPPKSLREKDTTQSRYFCVFKDCAFHNREQHADVNAAINIGRRFLGSLKK